MWLKKYFIGTSLYFTFRAIRGALLGVFGGLGIGLVIWLLLLLLDLIIPMESPFRAMPPSIVAFLTMILGAVSGGVFGFCAAMKETENGNGRK